MMWHVETFMQYCKPMRIALPTASYNHTAVHSEQTALLHQQYHKTHTGGSNWSGVGGCTPRQCSQKGKPGIGCSPMHQLFINAAQRPYLFNDTFSLAPELSGQSILIFIYCIHYFFSNSSHLC